jgi:hypothetical protein
MTIRTWVYRVEDFSAASGIDVPSVHRFLGATVMHGKPYVVFLVDADSPPETTQWRIYPTGQEIPAGDAIHLEYVATIPDSGAGRHLFRYVETPTSIFS